VKKRGNLKGKLVKKEVTRVSSANGALEGDKTQSIDAGVMPQSMLGDGSVRCAIGLQFMKDGREKGGQGAEGSSRGGVYVARRASAGSSSKGILAGGKSPEKMRKRTK